MAKKEYVMACPKCGGTNVHADLSKDMIAWGGTTRWLCGKCGYSASMFPEVMKSELPSFMKQIKTRTKKQERTLKELTVSKGLTDKTVSRISLLMYAVIPIFSLIILVWGLTDERVTTTALIGLEIVLWVSLAVIAVIILRKKK